VNFGRMVKVPLVLEWEEVGTRGAEFEREFLLLSDLEDDPLGQYIKLAKARGETKYSDELTIQLLIALHQKVDTLTRLLQNEAREYLALAQKGALHSMGHEGLLMEESCFKEGELYYARINLPVFPQRIVALFISADSDKQAHVQRIHDKDRRDWDSYIVSRERAFIREAKGEV